MQEINKNGMKIFKYSCLTLLLLSVVAAISKIFVGFDIDEGYALALPYRLLEGDKLFLEMWEIHQTSAVFAALIMWPFIAITGHTTGIVLYVRVVCTVIHFIISLFLYKTLTKYIKKEMAFFLTLIYFNFLPKWMMSIDFSIQFTWFFTICILCFILAEVYYEKQEYNKVYICMVWNGISLSLLVLGYPTMLILYPVFIAITMLRKKWNKQTRIKSAICLTVSCAVLAIVFVGYLLSYMSFEQLLASIPNVFSDGSHQFDADAKWSLWAGHIKDVILQTIITLVPAVFITVILLWIEGKKDGKKGSANRKNKFGVYLLCVYICMTSLIGIFANVIQVSWGPFRLQIRYIVMFVLGFFLIKSGEEVRKAKWICNFCMIPVLASFVAILIASNVGPTSSSSYLVMGIMAVCWLLMTNVSATNKNDAAMSCFLSNAAIFLFIISLIMCKGYYVRVTEYPPSNILEERRQITEGPAKGIFVYPSEYDEMMETYDRVSQDSNEEDLVLYLGTQTLSNLYTKGRAVIPTTISTPAFNEQWVDYFELHEEKRPTVIFLSKSTIDNQEKFFEMNPFGMWIAEHYDVENRIDTEYLCIIR